MRLLGLLWAATLPLVVVALLLSEYVTPMAEIRSGEANLLLRGRAEGGRLASGYWFKEPTADGGMRILNIATLLSSGKVRDVTLYEFRKGQQLTAMSRAATGTFADGQLILDKVVENRISEHAASSLADAQVPDTPMSTVVRIAERRLQTTLTPERLLARVLVPERMSILTLLDYIDYLHGNQLQAERQVVALWRKLAYPFTLLVMITIAAPIGFMQTRRGGVGAKVFVGILLGVAFFMVNQLALNVGMLSRWPPWLTALGPNLAAVLVALGCLLVMESRHSLARLVQARWPWRRSAV